MTYSEIVAKIDSWWKKNFVVTDGRVWKKNRKGARQGKPLSDQEIAECLSAHEPELRSSSLTDMGQMVENLKSLETVAENFDSKVEEVDPWFVEIMMAFRWKSDGQNMRAFMHLGLLEKMAKDLEGEPTRELQPIAVRDDGLAVALQSCPELWNWVEEMYRSACSDPEVYVTAKRVTDKGAIYHTLRGYLISQWSAWMSDMRFSLPDEPDTISNDRSRWAFWYFGEEHLAGAAKETPAWEGWLRKMTTVNAQRVFRAWIFSVFLAKNRGRQMLWIEGPGGDGKGSVANALMRFMGDRGSGAMSSHMLEGEFGAASAYGKRLLVHPDNKNPRLLSSALIHQITGGDRILVNQKFQTAFTARMDAKLFIAANCPPDADTYNMHEKSRLIYIRLDPLAAGADKSHLVIDSKGNIQLKGDTSFSDRLLEELPGFLLKCSTDYMELCGLSHSNIILPDDVVEEMDSRCASQEQEGFEKFYSENFDPSPDCYVTTETVAQLFENAKFKISSFSLSALQKYLAAMGHLKCRRYFRDGTRPRVYLGLKCKGTEGECLSEKLKEGETT